jgi:hypothetical protein
VHYIPTCHVTTNSIAYFSIMLFWYNADSYKLYISTNVNGRGTNDKLARESRFGIASNCKVLRPEI